MTAIPLAETPTIFLLTLVMWAMARFCDRPGWGSALWFTFAVTGAALMRPEGALAAVAFAPAMAIAGISHANEQRPLAGDPGGLPRLSTPAMGRKKLASMALVCVALALAPFAAWTWRNWQVFGVFEPLAPRMANDPGEDANLGWERWVKTWCLDFSSTYQIYWNVPNGALDVSELPRRAFDSAAQRAETEALANDYESRGEKLTPALDARFERLAEERIAAHPVRYYVWLPLGRLADMWLRPRVESMNIDLDWWAYARHNAETRFSWAYAGLNGVYLLLAGVGLWLRPRFWPALVAYMVLRSALLLTVAGPETRYTLECFPMLIALSGVAVGAGVRRGRGKQGTGSKGTREQGNEGIGIDEGWLGFLLSHVLGSGLGPSPS